MRSALPNFIYIGPSKAGSTWLYDVLAQHPDIYLTPAKDLYFFDSYYDRGLGWYQSQFAGAHNEKIIGEICHDYLCSPAAAERIAKDLPGCRLMISPREPAERAFSEYLYLCKYGLVATSFEDAIKDPKHGLVEHGCYATHIRPYLERFEKKDIHVALFDDLEQNPKEYARGVFTFLKVAEIDLPDELMKPALPAARARWARLSPLIKGSATLLRRMGFEKVLGRIKRQRVVHSILFKPYAPGERPKPNPETLHSLRQQFASEVFAFDAIFGTNCAERWGYTEFRKK